MVSAALSKLAPWSRARRWRKFAFEPEKAPHRQTVLDLVRAHLPPLTSRLRVKHTLEMVDRILHLEPSPGAFEDASETAKMTLLIMRMQQAIEQVEVDRSMRRRRFSRFSEMCTRIDDPVKQRAVVAEYLQNTATNAKALKGDLEALERYMGYDVVRERHAVEMAYFSICIETGIEFIGRAAHTCLTHSDLAIRLTVDELFERTRADAFLARYIKEGDRWHLRFAAIDGLFRIYKAESDIRAESALATRAEQRPQKRLQTDDEELAGVVQQAINDNGSSEQTTAAFAQMLYALEASGRNVDEHWWAQGKAIETLFVLVPDLAHEIVRARLFEENPKRPANDFLLRRLALTLACRYLPPPDAAILINRVIEHRDPSEHVRIGTCEAMELLPTELAVTGLTGYLTTSAASEKSARVRTTAVITLCRIASKRKLDSRQWEQTCRAISHVFNTESSDLVLVSLCEDLPGVVEALVAHDRKTFDERWAPAWLGELQALSRDDNKLQQICDATAFSAEALERLRDGRRSALTTYLQELTERIPPGKKAVIRWAKMPDAVRDSCRDPVLFGRSLAELTESDWGIQAHLGNKALVIWRGDHFAEFRLWRLLHEVRHPAPNKRQAFRHTRGRKALGEVRAPSSRLDEVTPTTVPGERCYVPEAGGWGRYLPRIDDILDLPIFTRGPRVQRIFTGHGITELRPAQTLWRRLRNHLWLSWNYAIVANLRQACLAANEPAERHKYIKLLADKLDVKVTFTAHEHVPPTSNRPSGSERLLTLFRGALLEAASNPPAIAVPVWYQVQEWFAVNGDYFLSFKQNSQAALAIFLTAFFCIFTGFSHYRRRKLAKARDHIPLSIGGWGTRGKSGTERLKAGLFYGLGYHVFAKTTGCEAMFIRAAPGQPSTEIFLYRAYDKASIWEQADCIMLAAGVHADVFLWECMALNPRYVEILQHDWVRDDLVTLTNAYPDHEDIQGPAGMDVAEVIARFIPTRGTCITSETNFWPIFNTIAKERGTTLYTVTARDAELIAEDVLALFPYSEHPRNIALVARMSEELEIDRQLAIITMAEHVVPDLGVLKAYGPANVKGRMCTFICGNSANERTGFLNNWRRMGLDKLDVDNDFKNTVITVVNNRADRISRSKVFADILVNDTAVDRHVCIGTNLTGLQSYINTALDAYLAGRQMIQEGDFTEQADKTLPKKRIDREMKRMRIPVPSSKAILDRLALYATGANLRALPADSETMRALGAHIDKLLIPAADQSALVSEVKRQLQADAELNSLFDKALVDHVEPPAKKTKAEAFEPPGRAVVIEHVVHILSRMIVRVRLEDMMNKHLESRKPTAPAEYHAIFSAAYRELFNELIVIVHDPGTTGDRIIEICAESVPPGTDCALLGTQNIKGTGLDFVYRWLAIDKVRILLDQLDSERAELRMAALQELDGYEDYGLFGAGMARAVLSDSRLTLPSQEDQLRERVLVKVKAIAAERLKKMSAGVGQSRAIKVLGYVESWLDYLDSIRRRKWSAQLMNDLVNQRVSVARAAIEMRNLVGRQKGGWPIKTFQRSKS